MQITRNSARPALGSTKGPRYGFGVQGLGFRVYQMCILDSLDDASECCPKIAMV